MSHGHAEHDPRGANAEELGYEPVDANIGAIVTAGIILTVFAALVLVGVMRIYHRMYEDRAAPETPQSRAELGKNMLIHQRDQLLHLRKEEDAVLTQYGWVDHKAGVVRVPIERAIDLVAERGIPGGGGPKTDVEINSHAGTPASAPGDSNPKESDSKKSEPKQ